VGTFPKSNKKVAEREKIDTTTHRYMTANFPCLVDTSIKSGGVKLVLWAQLLYN